VDREIAYHERRQKGSWIEAERPGWPSLKPEMWWRKRPGKERRQQDGKEKSSYTSKNLKKNHTDKDMPGSHGKKEEGDKVNPSKQSLLKPSGVQKRTEGDQGNPCVNPQRRNELPAPNIDLKLAEKR